MRRIFAVAALVALGWLGLRTPETKAGGPCAVPKSWGAVKGVMPTSGFNYAVVLLEDDAGRVRGVSSGNCKPVFELTRTDE